MPFGFVVFYRIESAQKIESAPRCKSRDRGKSEAYPGATFVSGCGSTRGVNGPRIPLLPVQRWLGHAQFTTTAIYAEVVGAQEKKIAERMR